MQKQLLCDKLILTIIPAAVSPSAYLAACGLELLLGPRPLSSACLPCNDSGQGLGEWRVVSASQANQGPLRARGVTSVFTFNLTCTR